MPKEPRIPLSPNPARPAQSQPAAPQDQTPRTTTNALMHGGKRLVIQHNEEDYILQITRAGRLILTK